MTGFHLYKDYWAESTVPPPFAQVYQMETTRPSPRRVGVAYGKRTAGRGKRTTGRGKCASVGGTSMGGHAMSAPAAPTSPPAPQLDTRGRIREARCFANHPCFEETKMLQRRAEPAGPT